jgi:putative tricarboxylic transport membrane protein
METGIVFTAGILCGMMSGILPGVGSLVVMTLAFPFLMTLDPVNILIFYVTLISIDQFFNGITAIVFGMPGSSGAIPSSIEGHAIFRRGDGGNAIMYSAIGSYFASIFGVTLMVCLLPVLWTVYGIWTTTIQAGLFTFAVTMIMLVARNKLIFNVMLFALGSVLARIGWDESTTSSFLTFDMDILYTGIPILPVMSMLFVLPMLLATTRGNFNFPGVSIKGYLESARNMGKYAITLIRSSFLGAVGGFVPGLTYGFSSVLSYTIERWSRKRKGKYSLGDTNCLIASESSNNAGAFTQLIPLLFLGIPITTSEAMIYHILEARGLPVSIEWFSQTFTTVTIFFLASATIGLFLSAKYVNVLKILNGIKISYVYVAIMTFLLISIYTTGQLQYAGMQHIIIALMLAPIGLMLTRFDTTPLVIGYILHHPLFDSWERMVELYW